MQASPVAQKSFLWKVPGKRIAVDLRLPVVDQITGEALDGMQDEGRGIEAGGLLLGRVRREGGVTVVEVEDAEPIECEHAAGPSLMLSASDRQSLEAQLKRRKGAVVGFYRTNTRREFAVTMEDVALMSWYFSRASDVFLLAHTAREAPLRAAFVTWAGRSLGPTTPADEFPFSSAALERQSHGLPAPIPPPATPAPKKVSQGGAWIAGGVIAAGLVAGAVFERLRPSEPSAEVAHREERVARPAPAAPAPATQEVAAATPTPEPVPVEEVPAAAPTAPPTRSDIAAAPIAPPPSAVAEAPIPAAPQRPTVVERTAPPALAPAAVLTSPTRTADRQLQTFVPPRAPRASGGETRPLPDLPGAPLPVAAPFAPLVSAAAAPPPATPAASAVVSRPAPGAGESPVSVAVDAMSRVRAAKFVPPTAVRQERPHVPADLRRRLTRDVLINVRVYVDPTGKVDFAELLSDGTGENRELAALAVFASRRWQFAPANRDGKPVAAQAVLRFRFTPEAR